ncbi:MAG: class I SAM-dependent methyltransferase [Gammaproteobacteria bacterium]
MYRPVKELSRTLRIPFNRYFAFRRLKEYHAQPRSLEETVDWAMRFGRYGYFTIHTLQKRSEIIALAKVVAVLQPKIILEIGTARGGTLLVWSSIASDKVITCDLVHRDAQRPLLEALPPPASKCRVKLLTGNSHEAAFKQRIAQELNGRKADFLFIDGDHTESGVAQDYNDYKEFVRPGGIIAFHDIVENQPLPTNQVYHLWKKVKPQAITEEFVNDPKQCGFGIGIIRMPA